MAKKATIAGNTFLFTGKLTEFTREDAETHVKAEGGKVLSGVSDKLNYLVVGEDAGSKLAKAEALGTVTILHEKEFLKMMSSGKKAPGKAVKATVKAVPKKIAKSTAKVNSVSKHDSTKIAIDEIKIGKQIWCVKNLDVTNFRNGDPIPEAKTYKDWVKAGKKKQPAWCYYDNDSKNGKKYGKLYNWWAISDARGLAPEGFHIPSDAEWTILTEYLGGEVGTKMKSGRGFNEYYKGTNSSGFSGFPGGYRSNEGSDYSVDNDCYWWSSTENNTNDAMSLGLQKDNGECCMDFDDKGNGYFVRCLRDSKLKNANSNTTTVSSINSETMPQDKNEIILNIKLPDLKKILKKYASSSITDKILTSSESIQTFGDISSSDESFFYFIESEGKLIMNYMIQDNDDEFRLDQDFFKELSKHANADFKIVYVNRNLWALSFCLFSKGEIQFSEDSVNEWEDPMYFDDYPYFVKLAKTKGMKKKKDEFGDKVWDSEEVYDLIYEFRDSIAAGYEYVNLAPNWYKDYKSIPN